MKKSTLITLACVALGLIIIFGWFFGGYNDLVSKQEAVNSQWAQVENVYQRRADLIPNLVETVKGVANFEKGTLTAVIEARAKATQVKVDPTNMTAAQLQNFQQTQDGLSSSLSRLMVVVERYAELKGTQNFSTLQAQLEGTENRCTVERQKFNEVAQDYNIYRRVFPRSIIAGICGFQQKPYFQAQAGAATAPKVQF